MGGRALTFDNSYWRPDVVCWDIDRSGCRFAFGMAHRSLGASLRNDRDSATCTTVRRSSNGPEVPMPALNWFVATLIVLLLCGLAIAAPLMLGMVAAA